MTLPRRSTLLAASALLLAACGSAPAAGAAAPVGDPGPHGTLLVDTCASHDFPPSALRRPPNAENGTGDRAALLRSFVATEEGGMQLPRHGWIDVLATDTVAVYFNYRGAAMVDSSPAGGGTAAGVSLVMEQRNGRWSVGSWGECRLSTELRARGYDVVPWRLDPQVQPPGPYSTSVVLDYITEPCGPDPTRDRFDHAIVDESASSVTITVFLRPRLSPPALPSGQAYGCLDIDQFTRHTVHLPHPLGAHTLLDGETQPPRPPRTV